MQYIFDFDKIQDRSTYDKPDLTPDGIDYVLVNGVAVVDTGKAHRCSARQVL